MGSLFPQRYFLWKAIMDKRDREFFHRVEIFFFSRRESFFLSREFFHEFENFVIQTRIFTSSREYFCRVENNFFMSQSVEEFFLESRFFCRIEIFSYRIENTQHVMPSFAAKMIKQYGGLQICCCRFSSC